MLDDAVLHRVPGEVSNCRASLQRVKSRPVIKVAVIELEPETDPWLLCWDELGFPVYQ